MSVAQPPPDKPLLQVKALRKRFGGNVALAGIDFELFPGEMLGLIGPNGAGKSTTFNALNGQLQVDAGVVELSGQNLLGLSPQAIWALGVGRTFQVAQTFASMTSLENVQMALLSAKSQLFQGFGTVQALHTQEAQALLEQVGLGERSDQGASTLAYGDVKRLELAMALASRPRLLLMDEPTAGMSACERLGLMGLIRKLVKQPQGPLHQGLSVLFTEHSMDVVFGFADRIMVLSQGQIIAQGSPQAVAQNPLVQKTYLGASFQYPTVQPEPSPP
jgi:branched-chain amino acid transport system ATP-binding protein